MEMTFSEYDQKRDVLVATIPNKNKGFYPNFEKIYGIFISNEKDRNLCIDYFIWLTETAGKPSDEESGINMKKIRIFLRKNLVLCDEEDG